MCEERRDEALATVLDGAHVLRIELGALADRAPDHARGHRDGEAWHPEAVLSGVVGQLVGKLHQVGKGGVHHHGRDRGIAVAVEQRGGGAHGVAPEADRRDLAARPEVCNGGLDVLPLKVAQGHVLAVRQPRACEVEREHGDRRAEQVLQQVDGRDPAGGVTMEVNHAGQLGGRRVPGLELPPGALQLHAPAVLQLHVFSAEALAAMPEL
mmetsp:Transcript_373/g.728  ORF Transcript_373/g.728 Transcript_373/m.728 type:complete len:210 (+) Transcript_373:712-1341(+)